MTKTINKIEGSKRNFYLNIDGPYTDFKDFFDTNKRTIYGEIVQIFEEFKETKRKTITLYVKTTIDTMQWDTKFSFFRNESIVLKRDILPYFETIEDYETCEKINNLHKFLTS